MTTLFQQTRLFVKWLIRDRIVSTLAKHSIIFITLPRSMGRLSMSGHFLTVSSGVDVRITAIRLSPPAVQWFFSSAVFNDDHDVSPPEQPPRVHLKHRSPLISRVFLRDLDFFTLPP